MGNIGSVERIELGPSDRYELGRRLQILQGLTYNGRGARTNHAEVSVTYYAPCTDKNHFAYQMKGQYITKTGIRWKVDPKVTGTMTVGDIIIPLCDVIKIGSKDEGLFAMDDWKPCWLHVPLRRLPGEIELFLYLLHSLCNLLLCR